MPDQPKPPLWRVLQSTFNEDVGSFCLGDGFGETCGDPDPDTWSAMIRAVADWVESLGRGPHHFIHPSHIASLLRAEADRAEAGE